jgi:HAD superfamily hydrolase (TIGR01509 family)
MNAIHRLVGMGGDQLVPRLLGHDSEVARQARQRYYRELTGEVHAFPGAADLMRYLHDRGVAVVLATSSPQDELDAAIRILDTGSAVDAYTTKDDVEESKPAPDLFRAALRAGAVDPHLALVVGDSVWDIDAASDAGLPCVGVETGGFSHQELLAAGAVEVHRDVQDLLHKIKAGPIKRLFHHAT